MEKSSFFNSVSHDRKYSAEDWAAYFASFISNGVFAQLSDALQVMINTGMNISIKPGISFINGYRYENTTDLVKSLAVADGIYNRIDRVVVRWSLLNRTITAEVLHGAPATVPVAPALTRNAEIYELALADVYIGAGITAIAQSDITDCRADSALCGFVTGLVDQFDFSTLTAQFDAFLEEYEAQTAELLEDMERELEDLKKQVEQAASGSLIDKSVTRAKLAPDALYSPWISQTSANYNITAADLGKTIRQTSAFPGSSSATITLTQTVSAAMPHGAEIAIIWMYGTSCKLQASGVRFALMGNNNYIKSGVSITDRFGMIAIKKYAPDATNGDLWLVTGPAEVIA